MTAATQLSLYNGALTKLGERTLASLTENREARRALDDVWSRNAIDTCLAAGLWNFAGRSVQFDYDPDKTPAWGYQCAFEIPDDWIRFMAVSTDPYFQVPLLQYSYEGAYFYCDLQRLWARYVSNDATNYGGNLSIWPDNFQRYVEAYLAAAICMRVTGSKDKTEEAEKEREITLLKAKSTDAMNESTTLLPPGNWRQARHGRRANLERGNPYRFYG